MPKETRKIAKNATASVKRAVKSGQFTLDKKRSPYSVGGFSGTVSKKGKVKIK